MKKMLLMAALVGVAFTSCVKNEEAVSPKKQQQIVFEPAAYKAGSRSEATPAADEGTVAFPTNQTFGTFAYYRTTASGSEAHSVFMDNVEVAYVAAATPYWAPVKTYYWPTSDGAHLDFISYYPYNTDKTSAAVPQILNEDNQQTMTYTGFQVVDATPIDLMYSDKAMQQTRNTSHYNFVGVPTLFHHALAKLNFLVKATVLNNSAISPDAVTNWEITIKKITLANIYDTGSVTLNTTNDHTQAGTVAWINSTSASPNVWANTSSTTTKEWAVEQKLTTTAVAYGSGTTTEAKNYFVLPQALVNDQQSITIDYSIKTTAPGSQSATTDYTKTVHFVNYPSVAAWEMGKNITYTIQIDPEGDVIHFAPAVVDWVDVNGTIDF